MKHKEEAKEKTRVCTICGKPSEEIICEPCKIKVRGEALEHKIEEEKAGKTDTGRR